MQDVTKRFRLHHYLGYQRISGSIFAIHIFMVLIRAKHMKSHSCNPKNQSEADYFPGFSDIRISPSIIKSHPANIEQEEPQNKNQL